jgi:hypothetical protein
MRRLLIAAAAALAFASQAAALPLGHDIIVRSINAPPPIVVADDMTKTIPTPLPPRYDIMTPEEAAAPPHQVLLGDYAAAALQWMAPIFAPVIASLICAYLLKLLQSQGITVTDAQRQRLQEVVENGVNLAAHGLGKDINGKLPVADKSHVIAETINYVQAHAGDTIKQLGFKDPTDPKVAEAIKARVTAFLAQKEAVAAKPVAVVAPAAVVRTPTVTG